MTTARVSPPAKPDLRRTAMPTHQPGAARFSEDAERLNAVEVVRIAKRCGLLDELIDQTSFSPGKGRPRVKGCWALAYLAFVQAGEVDIQPWVRETSSELWWECGFDGRPRYHTIYRRFRELESSAVETFFDASAKLIALAMDRSGGRVGFDVMIDCSEADTNARLHHDCQPGEGCSTVKPWVFDRHGRKVVGKDSERKASVEEAKAHREAVNAQPFDPRANLSGDTTTERDAKDGRRIRVGGHWYRLLDADAGVRAYTRGSKVLKFWAGYYNLKVTCVHFGLPILTIVDAADEQEYNLFPEAINRLADLTGSNRTRAVIADRGFAVKEVFEQCHQRGITLVAPLRRERGDDDAGPQDRDAFDRDGIPRCKFCGNETSMVRFAASPKPRLWFHCARPRHGVCTDAAGKPKVQTTLCAADSRYLQPLWRNQPAYQALLKTSFSFERAHHHQRQRNANGGNHYANTPKRTGRQWQQLRANAAIVLDWLKLLDRMGWLPGSINRLDTSLNRNKPYALDGTAHVLRIEAERRVERLNLPYGPAAVKLGIGPLRPHEHRDTDKRVKVRNADTDTIDATVPTEPAPRKRRRKKTSGRPATTTPSRTDVSEHLSADLGDLESVTRFFEDIDRIAQQQRADLPPPGDPPDPPAA